LLAGEVVGVIEVVPVFVLLVFIVPVLEVCGAMLAAGELPWLLAAGIISPCVPIANCEPICCTAVDGLLNTGDICCDAGILFDVVGVDEPGNVARTPIVAGVVAALVCVLNGEAVLAPVIKS
jgi:hypothetical protein